MWLGVSDRALGADGPWLPPLRWRACGKQFNERSGGKLNHTCLPSSIIASVGGAGVRPGDAGEAVVVGDSQGSQAKCLGCISSSSTWLAPRRNE